MFWWGWAALATLRIRLMVVTVLSCFGVVFGVLTVDRLLLIGCYRSYISFGLVCCAVYVCV